MKCLCLISGGQNFTVHSLNHLHILAHHYVIAQIHCKTYYQSKTYLTDYLELPFQSILVFIFYLLVVIKEAYRAKP